MKQLYAYENIDKTICRECKRIHFYISRHDEVICDELLPMSRLNLPIGKLVEYNPVKNDLNKTINVKEYLFSGLDDEYYRQFLKKAKGVE